MTSLSQSPHSAQENPIRRELAARWQRGLRYAFLDGAFRYLAECESDPQIVLLAIRGLCELGLGGPARELIDQRNDLASDDASIDVEALRRSVSALPSGRAPWERRREIFDRNFHAMCAAHREFETHGDLMKTATRDQQLFESNDGRLHLSTKRLGAMRQWTPALTDYPELRDTAMPESEMHRPLLVLGVAMNDLIRRAFLASHGRKPHGTVPIFVVEPNPARLAAWLHATDESDMLSDPRIHFFTGDRAAHDLAALLRQREDLQLPTVRLTCFASSDLLTIVDDSVRAIHIQREHTYVRMTAAITERTSRLSPAQWAQRLKPGAKILGITSRFTTMLQYSMRDIGHALEDLGYEFHRHIEPADHGSMSTLTVAREVHDLDPALIVLINHLRYQQAVSFGGTPVLSWIQDPMDNVLCRAAGDSIGPLDFVCGYFGRECVEQFGYPRPHFFDAFIPVSTRIFHDAPVEPDEAAELECDLMYVGHLHDDANQHLATWKQACPATVHPLLDRLASEVTGIVQRGELIKNPIPVVESVASETGFAPEPELIEKLAHMFVFRLYDIHMRRQTLHWVADWVNRTGRTFRLYGNGWSRDPILAPFAVGSIAHGEPLRRAYRCAALTLQPTAHGFLHHRTFEALACGSLVLARYKPGNFSFLEPEAFRKANRSPERVASLQGAATMFPDLSQLVFRDCDGFVAAAERLLEDQAARHALVNRMRETVIDRFTYIGILDDILNRIRERLAETPDHA